MHQYYEELSKSSTRWDTDVMTAATCARARKTGGRVSSQGEREREGGDEGDVGVTNKARWGRKMKARATHPDERGQACVHGKRHRFGASVPEF